MYPWPPGASRASEMHTYMTCRPQFQHTYIPLVYHNKLYITLTMPASNRKLGSRAWHSCTSLSIAVHLGSVHAQATLPGVQMLALSLHHQADSVCRMRHVQAGKYDHLLTHKHHLTTHAHCNHDLGAISPQALAQASTARP